MYIPSFKLISRSMLKKSPENADGRTDGRTDERTDGWTDIATNVDWSSVKSSDIHIRAISQKMSQPSITKICLKITCLKFDSNFPGANELTFVQARACCLTAPSHYLNQCRLIISAVLCFLDNAEGISTGRSSKNENSNFQENLPGTH